MTTLTGPAARAPGRARVRAGLWLLTALQVTGGGWMYLAPRSFYDDIPTVSADPPFNQHLVTDIGGLALALAVALGASAYFMDPLLIRVTLTAYLVYTVSHLVFHATHLAGLSPAAAAGLLTGLMLEPALAVLVLVCALRVTPRPAGPGGLSSPPSGWADRDSTPAGPGSRGRSW